AGGGPGPMPVEGIGWASGQARRGSARDDDPMLWIVEPVTPAACPLAWATAAPSARGRRRRHTPMLKVVVSESAKDEVDGHSVLDEIAREGARQMLVGALDAEVAAYL